jgi:Ca-activated chloride channel family protein
LLPFRDSSNVAEEAKSFSSVDQLISHLRTLSYDGGTNFKELPVGGVSSVSGSVSYNFYLLFTDGFNNLSEKGFPDTIGAPIYIFSSSDKADNNSLKILARMSGGESFKITSSTTFDTIVNSLGKPVFRYLGAEFDKNVIAEVFPSTPTPVSGTDFKLAGKISFSKATKAKWTGGNITLRFGTGIGNEVSVVVPLRIDGASVAPRAAQLAPRGWALRALAELRAWPDAPNAESRIIALGKAFGLTTPHTSLVVLESLDAYDKHDVEPPRSLPEIHRQWWALRARRDAQKKDQTETRVVSVLSMWKRRVAWWNDEINGNTTKNGVVVHCLEYGQAEDLAEAAAEWAAYYAEIDRVKEEELRLVQKAQEEAERRVRQEQIERENARILAEQKMREEIERRKAEEERKRVEEMRRRREEEIEREILR